jgi:hypothetical protein
MTSPTTILSTVVLPPLADLEWSLDDQVVMGPGRPYNVQTFTVGPASSRVQDADQPSTDGDAFGVDTRGGRLITLELNTDYYTADEALDALERFEGAWDAEGVRAIPGQQSILRWRRGTRVRRAYGRARDCLPDHSIDWTGNIGITATFKTMEPRFYDDTEEVEHVPFIPDDVGGLTGDLIGDIVASGGGVGERSFTIRGGRPTWMAVVIYGPITNPSVEFVDQWLIELNLNLGPDDYVVIDPSPWQRDVRRSNGENAGGALTAASRILSAMKLAPGIHSAILRGYDPTGSSRAAVYWRSCYASH